LDWNFGDVVGLWIEKRADFVVSSSIQLHRVIFIAIFCPCLEIVLQMFW
jgi:hypothetical protein